MPPEVGQQYLALSGRKRARCTLPSKYDYLGKSFISSNRILNALFGNQLIFLTFSNLFVFKIYKTKSLRKEITERLTRNRTEYPAHPSNYNFRKIQTNFVNQNFAGILKTFPEGTFCLRFYFCYENATVLRRCSEKFINVDK